MFLIGSGWFALCFLLILCWLLFSVTLKTIITSSSSPLGCCLQPFLASPVVIFYTQMVFFRSEVCRSSWHLAIIFFFFCLLANTLPTFISPPCFLGICLAHSRVTDQNPLLSAYRLHLALTVWKDHLHVCDEEIIDIFSFGILCRCQSPEKPLSPLTSMLSVLFLLLLCQSDTSSGIFKSGQSKCHWYTCTHN